MATTSTANRPGTPYDYGRITCAVLIVMALSGGPFVALSRWVAELPLALETWPYVYTIWMAAVLGLALFVLDVVAPIAARPIAQSEMLLVFISAPAALALWTLCSAFWTKSPGRTPTMALLMTLVVSTAIWFGYALTFRQQVVSLFIGLHLMTLVSLVISPILRSAQYKDETWMGIFNNPNTLSPIATLGIVAAVAAFTLTDELWTRVVIGLCVVADVIVAVEASSVTGWMALCGAVAAFGLVFLARGLGERGLPVARIRGIGATVVAVAVVSIPWSFGAVADLFGKDSSLTGRTETWDFVFDSVKDRWIIGFGFGSFWDEPANRQELFDRTGRTLDSAHSTFMETLLYLGGIGLLLLLVVVVLSVGRVWWEALGGQSWAMAWWAAVATFALIENVTESMIAYHSIFWVLLIAPGFAAMRVAAANPPPKRRY